MTMQVVPMDVAPMIPRTQMPQVDEIEYADLFVFLGAKGITFKAGFMSPANLKLHQEVDVERAMAMPVDKLKKPVLISSDQFVLDGDHRAYRHAVDKTDVPFIQIEAEFFQAFELLMSFPGTYEVQG